MKQYLQYPEYSVVALYKRLVIGCGFITPQGYISYLFTHPDWRRAGIAKYMLYQLVQACNSVDPEMMNEDYYQRKELNDITLHVQTKNVPGITLCEKFGFRQEAVANNFYRYFLPTNEEGQDAYFYQLKV